MLCFGKQITSNVYFNNKLIEKDDHYKYLGNVVGPSVEVIKIYFPETLHICVFNLERHF